MLLCHHASTFTAQGSSATDQDLPDLTSRLVMGENLESCLLSPAPSCALSPVMTLNIFLADEFGSAGLGFLASVATATAPSLLD